MPRELKQINGKWMWTGTHRSSDLEPAAPPPPRAQAAPRPQRPAARGQAPQKPAPQAKPWWEKVINDIRYEAGVAGRYLDSGGFRDPTISGFLEFRSRGAKPEGFHQGLATGAVGAADNAIKAAYSHYQRHVEKVPQGQADPSRGRFGAALDSTVERLYRGLGATPPGEMTPQQRSADQFRRSLALNVALIPVTRGLSALPVIRGAASMAPRPLRWGTELALNEALSAYLDDQTGGNIVNVINDFTGLKLPGGVDIGRADMVDAATQSLVPGAVAGQALGLGLSAAVGLGAKAFPNIRRSIRAQRAVEQELAERGRQQQAGLLEADEAGTSRFTKQAKRPTIAEENAAIDQRVAALTPSQGDDPSGFAKASDPGRQLPDADPADDPWWDAEPDPALPESTALGRAISELSDDELRAVAEGQGLPVVERVNQAIESRGQVAPSAPMDGRLAMAFTSSLPEEYVASVGRALEGMPDWQLRRLFDPGESPLFWQMAQAVSGVDDVAQLSRRDMIETIEAFRRTGETPLVSRMTGDPLVPVSDIADAGPQPAGALDDALLWDPSMEGAITVSRGDGGITVVDGRQRLALARRLGVPSLLVREGDAAQQPLSPRLGPDERSALEAQLLAEAIGGREVRPPDSPVPSLPAPPKARLDDLDDGAIGPGSKAAQAVADEVRLALEHARIDAAIQGEARAAAKEAMGWDLLPFEEKKRLGLGAGLGDRQLTLPGMDEGGLAQPPTRPVDIRVSGEDFSEAPRGWAHDEPLPQLPPDQVELKTKLLASIVRKVAGQDVGIRFQETYIDRVRPKEWGGDGAARMQSRGSYNLNSDMITLAGLGDGTAALGRQVETAYHEAFHRIQYVALGAKDAKVLDTLWARVKTAIGSNHVGGTASGRPIAYSETQAVAFQRYAGAIAEGQDPVAAMLGGYDASATSIEKAVARLASAFDRLLDFGEKVYNFFKNGTFDSTKGVFERARRGALAAAEGFEEAGSGFDRMTARADLGGWRATSWDLRRLQRQINANEQAIAEIRRKAQEDGC